MDNNYARLILKEIVEDLISIEKHNATVYVSSEMYCTLSEQIGNSIKYTYFIDNTPFRSTAKLVGMSGIESNAYTISFTNKLPEKIIAK